MKFMKLGSKPDTFFSIDNVRTVASDVSTDIVITVNSTKFLLHKFPLLSKSGRLQILSSMARQAKDNVLELHDFPGNEEAFEICAKFCYGIAITLSASNVVAVRSAAEYLEMREDVEMGNLIYKIEVFLNSCIYCTWKDCILTLKTTKALVPWSEDLNIVSRCIDAIALKAVINPSKVSWSYTYTRHNTTTQGKSEISGAIQSSQTFPVPRDWWVEDIAELDIDLYWRVMAAIKSSGKFSSRLIGEAVRVYAYFWLPGMSKQQFFLEQSKETSGHRDYSSGHETSSKHVHLLESIASLLPQEKGSVSCSFLLKLLRAATVLGASASLKVELAKRVGLQLEEALVRDLLIPSLSNSSNETVYDVDLIKTILEYFMTQDQSHPSSPVLAKQGYEKRKTRSAENIDLTESRRSTSATHSAKLRVGKLIDAYLIEIAQDANLSVSKFLELAKAIPDFARIVHDSLYHAIDKFFQAHPGLTKAERKQLCQLLDCKKLSAEASMHAAQNERLPLRLVVQILLYEQLKNSVPGGVGINELPTALKDLISAQEFESNDAAQSSSCDEGWEAVQQNFNSLKGDLERMKQQLEEVERERNSLRQEITKCSKSRGFRIFSSKRKCIFSRLWSGNKCGMNKET